MRDRATGLIDALRQPEYVGENRCLPCTVLNVAIAIAGSTLLAARSRRRRDRLFAVAAFGGSLAAIYLRGYLVPGTPELTKHYLTEQALAAFGKEPTREGTRYGGWETIDDAGEDGETDHSEGTGTGDAETDSTGTDPDSDGDEENPERETMERIEYRRENEVDPEAFLSSIGAVEPTADGMDLRLTEEFADRVEAGIERHREEPRDLEALADLFGVDRTEVTVKDRDYPAIAVGRRIRKWPSDGALVADLTTAGAIEDRTDRWRDVPLEQRVEILEALRAFHDRCPYCGGPISMSSDTVESCCRSYEVATLGCEECDAPLLEFDPDVVERSASDAEARL